MGQLAANAAAKSARSSAWCESTGSTRSTATAPVGLDLVPEHRGKGLSAKVYAWLLDYLFHQLNMHMVYLEVLESNARAQHVYERLGFHIDGRLRQRIFRNGTYEDSI